MKTLSWKAALAPILHENEKLERIDDAFIYIPVDYAFERNGIICLRVVCFFDNLPEDADDSDQRFDVPDGTKSYLYMVERCDEPGEFLLYDEIQPD